MKNADCRVGRKQIGRKEAQKNTPNSKLETRHFRYGWIPDLPDQRDYRFASMLDRVVFLPDRTDLSGQMPAVFDQEEIGSCTAQAWCAALQFAKEKQKVGTGFALSRLAFYYDERAREHSTFMDSGSQLRTGAKVAAAIGAGHETLWPYNIRLFDVQPVKAYYADATQHQALSYYRVTQVLQDMLACLATGYPFVLGFSVYESFESASVAKTGKAPMPKPGERVLGGHAVVAVGYDMATKRFLVRNSWGEKWGKKGYFTMPFEYLTDPDLSADFWTVRLVE